MKKAISKALTLVMLLSTFTIPVKADTTNGTVLYQDNLNSAEMITISGPTEANKIYQWYEKDGAMITDFNKGLSTQGKNYTAAWEVPADFDPEKDWTLECTWGKKGGCEFMIYTKADDGKVNYERCMGSAYDKAYTMLIKCENGQISYKRSVDSNYGNYTGSSQKLWAIGIRQTADADTYIDNIVLKQGDKTWTEDFENASAADFQNQALKLSDYFRPSAKLIETGAAGSGDKKIYLQAQGKNNGPWAYLKLPTITNGVYELSADYQVGRKANDYIHIIHQNGSSETYNFPNKTNDDAGHLSRLKITIDKDNNKVTTSWIGPDGVDKGSEFAITNTTPITSVAFRNHNTATQDSLIDNVEFKRISGSEAFTPDVVGEQLLVLDDFEDLSKTYDDFGYANGSKAYVGGKMGRGITPALVSGNYTFNERYMGYDLLKANNGSNLEDGTYHVRFSYNSYHHTEINKICFANAHDVSSAYKQTILDTDILNSYPDQWVDVDIKFEIPSLNWIVKLTPEDGEVYMNGGHFGSTKGQIMAMQWWAKPLKNFKSYAAPAIDNFYITKEIVDTSEFENVEGCYEKLFADGASYVEFEADINFDGTDTKKAVYVTSGDSIIELFDMYQGCMMLGDSITFTDTPHGWYNVKITLDYTGRNAYVTVTNPNGDVIERADVRYLDSTTSIDKLCINETSDKYRNVTINTEYTAPQLPVGKVNVAVVSTTKSNGKVLGATQLATNDVVALDFEYKNTDADDSVYSVFAAYYDNNGKLVRCDKVEDTNAYTIKDMTNVEELSFFVWDSVVSIKPMGKKYVIGDMTFADGKIDNLVTTFIGDAKTSRGFAWTADAAYTDMVVQYAEADEDFDTAKTQKVAVYESYDGLLYYKADVFGLTPGESYVYRIGDSVDNIWSKKYEFTTEAENVEEFTFLGIADTQSSSWEDGFEYLDKIMDLATDENPEMAFMVSLGDMVDDGANKNLWDNYFRAVEDYVESLPHMAVVGNHETRGGDSAGKRYSLYFNNPDNGANAFGSLTADDVSNADNKGVVKNHAESVYSFDYGDVHFAVLNSGSDNHESDIDVLLTQQAKWLRDDLSATDKKWKIVMVHQTVYPAKTERYDTKEPLLEVIDEFEVDLVLEGHDHYVARTYPMRGDEVVTKANPDIIQKGSGTVYNILGSAGPKRYSSIVFTPKWFKAINGTVASKPTYTTFKVDADSINVITKQIDGTVVDSYEIQSQVQ